MKQAKCKICRRIGKKLFLKGERCYTNKCAILRRNYAPGVHGPKKGFSSLSEYGRALKNAQEIKKKYGVNKVKPIVELEKRLDNVIYRLGFAVSRPQARQKVSHGKVLVNSKKVTIPSYKVKLKDKIKLKKGKIKLLDYQPPKWLNLNKKQLSGEIVGEPDPQEVVNN